MIIRHKIVALRILFALFLLSGLALAETVWLEDFNTAADQDKGAIGPGPVITSPSSGKWSVNVDNCTLADVKDWFKVTNNVFEGVDLDGTQGTNGTGDGAIWTSESISITGYDSIDISLNVSLRDSSKHENPDFIKASYMLDDGSITQFGFLYDSFGPDTFSVSGLSGDSIRIYVEMDCNGGKENIRFDNVLVEGYVPPTSVDSPGTFSATPASASEIDLSWTKNGNSDNVMIVFNTSGTFTNPITKTHYAVSSSVAGGTVIYNGSGNTFNHSSLSSATHYFYKAWSVSADTLYSSGVLCDTTTSKEEPSNHVLSFSSTADDRSIELTWSDNDGAATADGFLIKASTTSLAAISAPSDGVTESDDTDFSDGSAIKNILPNTETFEFSGLNAETTYYFKIWPYSNSNSNIDYKTDGTVPSQSIATTEAVTRAIDLDFESSGGYTTNIAEFNDGNKDYFVRTNGSDISSDVSFQNIRGSYYFAAQDINAEGATMPLYLYINNVDISNLTDLNFSIYIAEDDDGSNQDYDAGDYIHVDYDIDNSGSYSNLIWVEGTGTERNSEPLIDTDFDGAGDGTAITSTFAKFSKDISSTGNEIDIRISFSIGGAHEDIALDDILLTGKSVQTDFVLNIKVLLEGAL